MSLKTSIKIKKFWYADVAADGGAGTNWEEIQIGTREATMQLNGSDADTTNYKNVLGDAIESGKMKGDVTLNFQLADMSPDAVAEFTGGTVTTTSEAITWEAPENPNQAIEKSFKFLTDKNVEFVIPRATVDAYAMVNDDDLHYHQINSTILKPQKTTVRSLSYSELLTPEANAITAFTFGSAIDSAPATIDGAAFTVAITVIALTVVTALVPEVIVSKGASITPGSGVSTDYTGAVPYTVTSADGTAQIWTVTVTVA